MENDLKKTHYQNKQIMVDDEVNLAELWQVVWQHKWVIFTTAAVVFIASVIYALYQPNIYKSEALLAPAVQEQSGLGALTGQFGGLASLAGVNLGSSSSANKTQLALEVLKSRQFTSDFITKYNLLPDLMAVKSWNQLENIVHYDKEIYDPKENKWLRSVNPPKSPEPSMQEAYKELRKITNTDLDKETGMINISIEHISPVIAQRWVNWLVEDINTVMKLRDVQEAHKSAEFLTKQLEKTKVADIRAVLYKLIEEQTKTIMFANVRDEYVFKTIDPAIVTEKRFKPNRILIVILGSLLGLVLGVVVAFIKSSFQKSY